MSVSIPSPGPQEAQSLYHRGNSLLALQRFGEALEAYQRSFELAPAADTMYWLGVTLLALGRAEQARTAFQFTLMSSPDRIDALAALTNACLELNQIEQAAAASARVLLLAPASADAHTSQGNLELMRGQLDVALQCFNRALALEPHNRQAALNKAFIKLLRGELREGWELYEARWLGVSPENSGSAYTQPRWDAQRSAPGSTVLLWAEQGLGDTLQFARYALELQGRGLQAVLEVQPQLKRLLGSLSSPVRVIAKGEPVGAFDSHCPLLSAPRVCGTELATIPAVVPYLRAPPERIEHWGRWFSSRPRSWRIGIAWAGNPHTERRLLRGRSLPLDCLERLFSIPEPEWFVLQHGTARSESAQLHSLGRLHLFDESFDHGPDAFLDTASVIQHLDLVITTDTAIAHLAGALGAPTWLLLHETPDWRWLQQRADSPWYPTLRLFRQQHGSGWAPVIDAVHHALAELFAQRSELPDRRPRL